MCNILGQWNYLPQYMSDRYIISTNLEETLAIAIRTIDIYTQCPVDEQFMNLCDVIWHFMPNYRSYDSLFGDGLE